jgi:hypothetical protein
VTSQTLLPCCVAFGDELPDEFDREDMVLAIVAIAGGMGCARKMGTDELLAIMVTATMRLCEEYEEYRKSRRSMN